MFGCQSVLYLATVCAAAVIMQPEIMEGEWEGKNTPDLTHAFLVGGAKEAVDVGSGGPRELNPPVEPGVVYAEIQETEKKSFCSSYELLNPGSASLSCRENSEIYEVVYIMRVR